MPTSIWTHLMGSQVRHVDAAGYRTRIIEAGEGPHLILLHGGGGHAEAFARNVVELAKSFHVVAVDYLGHGLTEGPTGAPTKDDYVAHLCGVLDALEIERAHLLGESLGGWIAFWASLDAPERVDRLISVCGARIEVSTDEASKEHVRAGRAEFRRLNEEFTANPSRDAVRNRLAWLFHDPESDITDELVDVRWAVYQRRDAQQLIRTTLTERGRKQSDALDTSFTPERLAQIAHPTLFLWTSHNPSNTAATARVAADCVPGSRYEVMQDCGHWPQWEDPETFNRIVADFLAE